MRKLKVSPPRALVGGTIVSFARRCWFLPRRLLTHSATDPEIQVIAAATEAEFTIASPLPKRRSARRITIRLFSASPRARPQTT